MELGREPLVRLGPGILRNAGEYRVCGQEVRSASQMEGGKGRRRSGLAPIVEEVEHSKCMQPVRSFWVVQAGHKEGGDLGARG